MKNLKTQIGGDRLGSGNKNEVIKKDFNRSKHDLSYAFRSTMSAGTLVPFMKEIALPGDKFEINLNAEVMTHPTIGPMFGSYKVQLDLFLVPFRLYMRDLNLNKLDIGMQMSNVKFPKLRLWGNILDHSYDADLPIDQQHVNSSSLLSYLDIKGLGHFISDDTYPAMEYARDFNALPFLSYWDIYKNYYANKQEEIGSFIHTDINVTMDDVDLGEPITYENNDYDIIPTDSVFDINAYFDNMIPGLPNHMTIAFQGVEMDPTKFYIFYKGSEYASGQRYVSLSEIYNSYHVDNNGVTFYDLNEGLYNELDDVFTEDIRFFDAVDNRVFIGYRNRGMSPPNLVTFRLDQIDTMKEYLLSNSNIGSSIIVNEDIDFSPIGDVYSCYTSLFDKNQYNDSYLRSILNSQEGLAIKTYQSDLFNNWLNTDWIDGNNGINDISSASIVDNKLSMDALNLSQKIYEMLNRIALSGGTYDDWLNSVYMHDRKRGITTPMYIGGLSKELAFQEVVSSAESGKNPLGTLAGRGQMTGKNKGGYVSVTVDEPSYIMGIISLTPRVDYSQGNRWDVSLDNMDDLHKPDLDAIAFQELITDQMAFWDTGVDNVEDINGNIIPKYFFKSAGKQPSWLNYMTNYNRTYGNFADVNNQMFMTLNRRYEYDYNEFNNGLFAYSINDLSTYIDPSKFNYIFAQTSLDAQNFWAQIGVKMEVSRKMSAKQIPNI
jgi:hypothetical protein